jgi:hypothetical protein
MRSIARSGAIAAGVMNRLPAMSSARVAGRARAMPRCYSAAAGVGAAAGAGATPSFFCRLVEEVVYWNTRRFSG